MLKSNYGTDESPEYQTSAYAYWFKGMAGSMAPRAMTNQIATASGGGGAARNNGAYAAFKQSGLEWGRKTYTPPKMGPRYDTPSDPPAESFPNAMHPAALANVLRGGTGGADPSGGDVPMQSNGGYGATLTPQEEADIRARNPNPFDPANGGIINGGGAGPTNLPVDAGTGGLFLPGHGAPATTPPAAPAAPPPADPGAGNRGLGAPGTPATPPSSTTTTGPVNPTTNNPYGKPIPPGVPPALWNEVDRWVQGGKAAGGDYSYLYDHPEVVTRFRDWQNDPNASPADRAARQQTDPVDWLKGQGMDSPLAGRNKDANGNPIDTWQRYQQSQQTSTTTGTGTGTGQTPPAATPPPNTTPPPTPTDPSVWRNTTLPTVPDDKTLATLLHMQYDPSYHQGQQDLQNILQGRASLTGDSNSGGYGDVLGREESRLIGSQNADFGDKLLTTREGALNRAQQQYATDAASNTAHYSIDANKFATALQNDTARYGIKTNADLQKYLGDQSAGLQKYGIDADTLKSYYIASLQSRGQIYGIDKGFDAQAMQDATNRYIADLNRKSQEDANNLGWGNLDVTKYGIDSASQQGFLQALQNSGLTPAQLAEILKGFTPGVAYRPPGG